MCCAACFRDHWIVAYIETKSVSRGECSHCNSQDSPLLPPSELLEEFEALLEAYTVKPSGGLPLAEILNQDWQIFSPDTDSAALLTDILGDANRQMYAPRRGEDSRGPAARWEALRVELRTENRFFPKNAPDRDDFSEVIGHLVQTVVPARLYRARTYRDEVSFEPSDMGPPPANVASDGRANPLGIPYLYLASDPRTAINEVRPSKGSRVAVAEFSPVPGANPKFIDLSNPRGTISPFAVGVDDIGAVRASMDFLCLLGKELSTPALPHRASIDYLTSQYLCELIKSIGYDGVIYESSLTGGTNYAVFAPDSFTVAAPMINYVVTGTDVLFTAE